MALDRTDLKKSTFINMGHKWDYTGKTEEDKKVKRVPSAGLAYDSKNKVIAGGVKQSEFYIFDPRTKLWRFEKIPNVKGKRKLNLASHCLIYDPVDHVYIFIGNNPEKKWHQKMWAYKWK